MLNSNNPRKERLCELMTRVKGDLCELELEYGKEHAAQYLAALALKVESQGISLYGKAGWRQRKLKMLSRMVKQSLNRVLRAGW